jgi:hypothetical protein
MKVTPSNDAPLSPPRAFLFGPRPRHLQRGVVLGALLGSVGLCLGVGCTLITDVDREKIPVTERPPFPEVDAGHFDAGGSPEPGDLTDAGSDAAPSDAGDATSEVDGVDAATDAATVDAG